MRAIYFTSLFCIIFSSCASDKAPNYGDNIVAGAYTGVVNQIKDLSNSGQLEKWVSSNQEPFQIKSRSDLETALGYFGEISEDQTELIEYEFTNSNYMYHFRYDGDFSVLVAFDNSGKQCYIYPPSMAPTT